MTLSTYGSALFPYNISSTEEPLTSELPITSEESYTTEERYTSNEPMSSMFTSEEPWSSIFSSEEPWSSMFTSEQPLTSQQPFTSNASHHNDDKNGFKWNAWYVYLIIALVALLIIGLVIYGVMKHRALTKATNEKENYHPLIPDNQENFQTMNGTNQPQDHHVVEIEHANA